MTIRDLALILLVLALACAIGVPDDAHDILRDVHNAIVRKLGAL